MFPQRHKIPLDILIIQFEKQIYKTIQYLRSLPLPPKIHA